MQILAHRKQAKEDLMKLGEVFSGECSCYEFMLNKKL
jgi:hypothetical protein